MVSQVLVKDFPEIRQAVRITARKNVVFEKPGSNDPIYETIFGADSNIFKVFTFPLVAGNPDNALNDINTLVISKKNRAQIF